MKARFTVSDLSAASATRRVLEGLRGLEVRYLMILDDALLHSLARFRLSLY